MRIYYVHASVGHCRCWGQEDPNSFRIGLGHPPSRKFNEQLNHTFILLQAKLTNIMPGKASGSMMMLIAIITCFNLDYTQVEYIQVDVM